MDRDFDFQDVERIETVEQYSEACRLIPYLAQFGDRHGADELRDRIIRLRNTTSGHDLLTSLRDADGVSADQFHPWIMKQRGLLIKERGLSPEAVRAMSPAEFAAALTADGKQSKGGRPKGTGEKAAKIRKEIEKNPIADDSDIALKCDASPKYVKQIRDESAADKMRSAVEIGTE